VRPTGRTGAKAGVSDPVVPYGRAIAHRIKGTLGELLALRSKLSDLRGNLQGNDKLDDLLQAALRDSAQLDRLKGEIAEAKGGEKEGTHE